MFSYQLIKSKSQSAPLLILIHGFMGNSKDWLRPSSFWNNQFSLLMIDLHHHLDSGYFRDFDDYIKKLGQFLIKEQFSKAILLGYSMGGRVALALALKFPHLFHQLIIESASPGIENEKERKMRFESDLHLLKDITHDNYSSFLQAWYDQDLFACLNQQDYFQLHYFPQKIKVGDEMIASFRSTLKLLSVGNQPNYWPQLHELKLPFLFISGEWDSKYTEIGKKIEELNLKNFSHAIIKEVGHKTHLEAPVQFAFLVSQVITI